ncbi:unnamed protein product [Linum tenue]|uniref:Uncharacterized protein n=1 Tax=Linum tenue TaxID=586396 RepID=A0AAV0J848_9ROSI|nr:unnamed protein product [Linum tenue]
MQPQLRKIHGIDRPTHKYFRTANPSDGASNSGYEGDMKRSLVALSVKVRGDRMTI